MSEPSSFLLFSRLPPRHAERASECAYYEIEIDSECSKSKALSASSTLSLINEMIFKDSMNPGKTGFSSMAPPPNYIDLSRTFAPVPQKAGAEEFALQSYAHHSSWLLRSSALTWDNLLEHGLIVLLGEPGSGKSYELQYQATLSSPGRPRFYLRLDELAASGTQFQLGADDARRVAEWQESRCESRVFLGLGGRGENSASNGLLSSPRPFPRTSRTP